MKKIKKILLFIAILLIPFTVSAKSVAEVGETITLEGDYNSNKVVAGDTITNNANIDGLTFIFGNIINEKGNSEYDFLFGNEVNIDGTINKDLFVASSTLRINKDAVINRDVYIASEKATIESNISRSIYFAGNSIDIRGITIDGNLYFAGTEIFMDDNTIINGTLKYNDDAEVKGMDKEKINNIKTYHVEEDEKSLKDEITSQILSVVGLSITMILIFAIFNKVKTNVNEMELSVTEFAKSLITGFSTLIAIPFISIMAMLTVILIPVSLISIVIYIIFIYLSQGFAGYMIGKALLGKLLDEKSGFIAYIFSGILIIKVLLLIPILESIVGAFSLFYGLGVIMNLINKMRK